VPAGRTKIEFGEFALKSLEPGLLSARQLEAARKAIVHHTKRRGRVWFRVFPDRPVTRKPAEVRMGGGKGSVEGYAAGIKSGEIILEIGAVNEDVAREALRRAAHKFPVKTRLISKEERQ
jgi:large subunit ribosomal protein L16